MMRERIAGLAAMALLMVERYIAHLDHKVETKAAAQAYKALLKAFVEASQ